MARLNTKNATLPDECEHVTWHFEPLRPLRRKHTGEVAYLRTFQRAMGGARQLIDVDFLLNDTHLFPFLKVMRNLGGPEEGDDRLVTSLMMWLGTNIGSGFRDQAQKLAAEKSTVLWSKEQAYIAAWAIQNAKIREIRGYPHEAVMENLKSVFNREVTIRDHNVLEQAAAWLGTQEGQDYLATAEKMQNRLQSRATAQRRSVAGQARPPHNLS